MLCKTEHCHFQIVSRMHHFLWGNAVQICCHADLCQMCICVCFLCLCVCFDVHSEQFNQNISLSVILLRGFTKVLTRMKQKGVYVMISVLGQQDGGHGTKMLNLWVFPDTVNVINVKLCMIVPLIEVYLFITSFSKPDSISKRTAVSAVLTKNFMFWSN